jgi:hypothetical protein
MDCAVTLASHVQRLCRPTLVYLANDPGDGGGGSGAGGVNGVVGR